MVTYLNNAIAACEQAINNPSDFVPACQTLGNVLQSMGKFEEAMSWHTQAVVPQPNPVEIYVQLGNLYAQQQQWQSAIAIYRTALSLQPQHSPVQWALADALSQSGQQTEALECWYQVLTLEPQQATVQGYCSLGDLFWQQGIAPRAIACYTLALQQDPQFVTAHQNLAAALKTLGRWDEAIASYRRAIEQNPDSLWLRYHLAEVLLQQSRWDEAIALSKSTSALNQDAPWAYSQMGRALGASGRKAEAIACYQKGSAARGWNCCLENGYQFTEDWFTHNIPVWENLLECVADAPQLNFLEVGSYEGMATCWLLDQILTHPSSGITCVDLGFQGQFTANLARSGAAEKVMARVGNSHDILPSLQPHAYDVIYIDGCPLASHVQQDAMLAWNLLKLNGLLIFDDYDWINPQQPEQSPKIGIDAFLSEFQHRVDVLRRAYQLIVRKIAA